MPDEIKKVNIDVYFPQSFILTEEEYKNTPSKAWTCSVEVRHFGKHGPHTERTKQGYVQYMRVIYIQDRETLDWMAFKKLEKRQIKKVQETIYEAVTKALGLKPYNSSIRSVVPREMILAGGE